jgi:hypothetical protein
LSISHELLGEAIRPRLTVDGLRNLIQDLRKSPNGAPVMILVSEYDRRDINQDLCQGAASIDPEAERPDHDRKAIAIIEGVPILSHGDIPRGRARLCYNPRPNPGPPKLGGEGLIIVGA